MKLCSKIRHLFKNANTHFTCTEHKIKKSPIYLSDCFKIAFVMNLCLF